MPAPYIAQRIRQIKIAAELNPENLELRQKREELRDRRRKQQREKRQSTRQLTSPRASSSHISKTPTSTHQTPIDLVEVTRQQLTTKDVLAENLRQLELYHARVTKAKAEKASDKRVTECENAVVRRMQKVQKARDKLRCLNEQVARLSASRDQTVQSPNPDTSSSEKSVVEKIATNPLSGHKEEVDNVIVKYNTSPALTTDNDEKRVVTPVNPRDMNKADNNVQQPDQPLDPNIPEKPATLSNQSNADKIDERPESGTKTAIAKSPSVSRTVIRHLPGTTIPDSEEEEG